MAFLCCGVKYSKSDPATYWRIETDLIKEFTKDEVNGNKVYKEVVETLICKEGCLQVHVKRFGKFKGKFKILEIQKLKDNIHTGIIRKETGEEVVLNPATEFLDATANIRIRQPQFCPIKMIPNSKNIPLCFGKTLSSTTQRARYINELGWGHNSEVIYSECKVIE